MMRSPPCWMSCEGEVSVDESMEEVKARFAALSPQRLELLQLIIEEKYRKIVRIKPRESLASSLKSQAPASYAQQRLWLIDKFAETGAVYHIARAVRLHGALNYGALSAALDTIVDRHEALRTTFRQIDGEVVQVIASSARFALEVVDLSGGSHEECEAEVRRQAEKEMRERMDLNTGPLLRGRLLRLHAAEHVLLLTLHHIVSDGWSMGILIREVGALYAAYSQGRANPLAPLAIQYADYALWQC